MKKYRYKFLREGLKSEYGDCKWKIGEWKKEKVLSICNRGFHCSKTPLQALSFVPGEIVAKVEVKGKSVIEKDKEVWEEMRLVDVYKWQKKDSVALAIYAAELCLHEFEKVYPEDKRPREAIEAAKNYLADSSENNRLAAGSTAESARSALAAGSAAESAAAKLAAWSAAAESAARSALAAGSAAKSAAAKSAAWSAAWSAEAAARSANINKWFIKHIKTLDKYE